MGTVGSPDFSLAAAPGSQSVAVGGNTAYTATVTAQNGFTGSTGFSGKWAADGSDGEL